MSGYILAHTCIRLNNERELQSALDRYRHLLQVLGYHDVEIDDWLSSFTWEAIEDFGFGDSFHWHFIGLKQVKFRVAPHINGFKRGSVTGLNFPWVELNLLFETGTVTHSPHSPLYRTGAAKGLWHIIRKCADVFNDVGIYLTDELNEGQPCYAAFAADSNFWSFDLALIPARLAPLFSAVPETYVKAEFDYGLAFAQRDRWPKLPWDA